MGLLCRNVQLGEWEGERRIEHRRGACAGLGCMWCRVEGISGIMMVHMGLHHSQDAANEHGEGSPDKRAVRTSGGAASGSDTGHGSEDNVGGSGLGTGV